MHRIYLDFSDIMGFFSKIRGNDKSDNSDSKNFRYLDKILSKDVQTIELEQDIVFGGMDYMSFTIEWGCAIYNKDIFFEGNGHMIDAKDQGPILDIMGSKCIFKNVNFMNGNLSEVKIHGGFIISVESDVEFIDCRFENFHSYKGTFFNYGNLTFKHCKFINNSASDVGAAINNQVTGKVNIIDCEFIENESNGGGAIYNMGEMIIRDSRFYRNTSQKNGGAIYNQSSSLTIEDCEFIQNNGKFGGVIISHGGSFNFQKSAYANFSKSSDLIWARSFRPFEDDVVHDISQVNFKSCKFEDNEAKDGIINIQAGSKFFIDDCRFRNSGGKFIISNWDVLEAVNCTFCENNTNFLYNNGTAKFTQCKFVDNTLSKRIAVYNKLSLDFIDCIFDSNNTVAVLSNKEDGECSILGGQFSNNNSKDTALYNEGAYFSITKTIFENNVSGYDSADDIYNKSVLSLQQPILKGESRQRIFNKGSIEIRDFSKKDVETFIKNEGSVEFFKLETDLVQEGELPEDAIPDDELAGLDFADLDKLIQKSDNIILSEDIALKNYELDFYEGGILLDRDNLTIDGNGHTIDANGRSRIFYVTGNNITLKNIHFKNGNFKTSFDKHITGGGTICAIDGSSVNLIQCTFEDSGSDYSGGAVFNKGRVASSECRYIQNNSGHGGGAVFNKGEYLSEHEIFDQNSSELGSAIYNNGLLKVYDCDFKDATSLFSSSQPIFNINQLEIDPIYSRLVLNVGDINKDLSIPPKSFEHIWILLNINPQSIVLNEDIVYRHEKDKNIDELIIDKEKGFVIDGNGFSIDAKNQPIVLKVKFTEKEIHFKNITFKNFNCIKSMIDNEARIIFENCKFYNNQSVEGNLIENLHMVSFYKCIFSNNSSSKNMINNDARYYSALREKDTLKLHYCIFLENNLKGNILLNKHKMSIENSVFNLNQLSESLILNFKESVIKNTDFSKNSSEKQLVINNGSGQLMIFDSNFIENTFVLSIFTSGSSDFSSISSTNFIKNNSKRGSVLLTNSGSYMGIRFCKFVENTSEYGSNIAKNNGRLRIQDSEFIKNISSKDKGIIVNYCVLDMEKNTFTDNTLNKGFIIDNKKDSYLNESKNEFNEKYLDNVIHDNS